MAVNAQVIKETLFWVEKCVRFYGRYTDSANAAMRGLSVEFETKLRTANAGLVNKATGLTADEKREVLNIAANAIGGATGGTVLTNTVNPVLAANSQLIPTDKQSNELKELLRLMLAFWEAAKPATLAGTPAFDSSQGATGTAAVSAFEALKAIVEFSPLTVAVKNGGTVNTAIKTEIDSAFTIGTNSKPTSQKVDAAIVQVINNELLSTGSIKQAIDTATGQTPGATALTTKDVQTEIKNALKTGGDIELAIAAKAPIAIAGLALAIVAMLLAIGLALYVLLFKGSGGKAQTEASTKAEDSATIAMCLLVVVMGIASRFLSRRARELRPMNASEFELPLALDA